MELFERYERCMTMLLRRAHGTDHYAEALIYEHRLMENISCSRLHGDTEIRASERAEIIDALNRFSLRFWGVAFSEMCEGEEEQSVPEQLAGIATDIKFIIKLLTQ